MSGDGTSEEPERNSFLDIVARAAAEEERKIKAGLSFVPGHANTKIHTRNAPEVDMVDVLASDDAQTQTTVTATAATEHASNTNSTCESMSEVNQAAVTSNSEMNISTLGNRTFPSSSPQTASTRSGSPKMRDMDKESLPHNRRSESETATPPAAPPQPRPNPYADERRKAFRTGTRAPPPLVPDKRKAPTEDTIGTEPKVPNLDEQFDPPDWYLLPSQLPKFYDTQQHQDFLELRTVIRKCEQSPWKHSFYHDHIRRHLHKLEHTSPRADEVQRSKLLEAAEGLPRLFAKRQPKTGQYDGYYPWDIRGDAKMLYKKWMRQDFDSDLLRGIKVERKKGKEGKYRWVTSLDKDFPNKMRANYFGEGSLVDGVVNGQWYPNQLCAVRDGAHGSAQAGIYGAGDGAYSIIVSTGNHTGGTYEDIDQGDTLSYVGTEAKLGDTEPTEGTKNLQRSLNTGKPVRVLRTARMRNKTFAPSRGVRYDGLYTVVGQELMDASKHHYRFHLVRDKFTSSTSDITQDPIRYQGIEKRPSDLDIERFDKVQALKQGSEEVE